MSAPPDRSEDQPLRRIAMQAPHPPRARLADRFGTLALLVVLGWVGWTTAGGLASLLGPRTIGTVPAPAGEAPESLTPFLDPHAMLAAGDWSFSGSDWAMGRAEVDEVALEPHLRGLAEEAIRAGPLPEGQTAPIEALSRLATRRARAGDHTTYHVERPGLRLVAVGAGPEDGPVLCGGAVALRAGDGRWLVLSLLPSPDASPTRGHPTGPSADRLLPLPRGAHRVATKWARAGRPLVEIVLLAGPQEDLPTSWRASGWRARRLEQVQGAQLAYHCSRGPDEATCWILARPGGGPALVLVQHGAPERSPPRSRTRSGGPT